jgi:CelD/BcsL family acetyltransferase involved in cellulose biosynthesis
MSAESGIDSPGDGAVPLRCEMIRTRAAVDALRPEWDRLWQSDAGADLFGSSLWYRTLLHHFGDAGATELAVHGPNGFATLACGRWEPRLCVVRAARGTAVALLPMIATEARLGGRTREVLALPLNAHAPRGGIVATRRDPLTAELLAQALLDAGADVLLLDGLRADDPLLGLLAGALERRGCCGAGAGTWPSAYLRYAGSHEQYLAGGERLHFRRSLVKATNGLRKDGTLSFECHRGADAAGSGYAAFLEIDAASWKATRGESIAAYPHLRDYYGALCSELARLDRIEIWILRCGGVPVAGFLCPHDGRHRYTLKSSYRDALAAKRSPSLVLLAQLVRTTWAQDARGIDFVGKVPFLERWATEDLHFASRTYFRSRYALLRSLGAERAQRALERLRGLARRLGSRPGHRAQTAPAPTAGGSER